MSSFFAYDFIFDNIPSQKYNLKIISFEDGSLFNGVGSSDVEIITQKVLRKSKPYYLGRTQPTVLEFPLTFGTAAPISGMERDAISAWLFGRSEYKRLYIMQDDLMGAYFNCFMTKPEPLYIGNMNYAFTSQVVCDSPWAYSSPHTVSASYVGKNGQTEDYSFYIYNSSSEDEYLYPIVQFTITHAVNPIRMGWFQLINHTDSDDRKFKFTYIPEGYQITVNNDLQTIATSDQYGQPLVGALSHFEGKNWFRLVPGKNIIGSSCYGFGDINNFKITWIERLKIGG